MDSHKIHNIIAYALPSPHHSGKLAGILGNDFMDETITVFDFPCRRLEILPNRVSAAALAGKGSPPFSPTIDKRILLISLRLSRETLAVGAREGAGDAR